MSRWSYTLYALVIVAVATVVNLREDSGGSRSWSGGSGNSGGASGGGWSSGGGGHK